MASSLVCAAVPSLAVVLPVLKPSRAVAAVGSALESLWNDAILLAVPKSKKSYSRKRMRQNNPAKALKNVQHFYPCPKCDKGLLKLHHHLCPCDMERLNLRHKKVAYGPSGAGATLTSTKTDVEE